MHEEVGMFLVFSTSQSQVPVLVSVCLMLIMYPCIFQFNIDSVCYQENIFRKLFSVFFSVLCITKNEIHEKYFPLSIKTRLFFQKTFYAFQSGKTFSKTGYFP